MGPGAAPRIGVLVGRDLIVRPSRHFRSMAADARAANPPASLFDYTGLDPLIIYAGSNGLSEAPQLCGRWTPLSWRWSSPASRVTSAACRSSGPGRTRPAHLRRRARAARAAPAADRLGPPRRGRDAARARPPSWGRATSASTSSSTSATRRRRPGRLTALADLIARTHALPLDRSRPLWELWVIEGLPDGRVALYAKIHMAALDDVTGAEVMTALLDPDPDAASTSSRTPARGRPAHRPAAAVRGALPTSGARPRASRAGWPAGRSTPSAARWPAWATRSSRPSTARRAWTASPGSCRRRPTTRWSTSAPTGRAPRVSWNGPVTGRRRFAMTRLPLDRDHRDQAAHGHDGQRRRRRGVLGRAARLARRPRRAADVADGGAGADARRRRPTAPTPTSPGSSSRCRPTSPTRRSGCAGRASALTRPSRRAAPCRRR